MCVTIEDNHHCLWHHTMVIDIVKCLLSSGADINLRNENGRSPLFLASKSGCYDIVILLTEHGALREENVISQHKTFSNGAKYDESPTESITLLMLISRKNHSKEKQEEEKEAIYVPKVQEEREETILTREQEETEEIIYIGETKEEKDKTTEGRKEQKK